jgi:hypothetical protein
MYEKWNVQLIESAPGYRPSGPAKTADEYAKLDAEDESLARWKASLGITPGQGSSAASGPKVCFHRCPVYWIS